MVGATLVLPGAKMDGPSIYELLNTYKVTFTAAVPTVWLMLLQDLEKTGGKLPYLKRVVIGGSACPRAMTKTFQENYGVEVVHAWGMTETSPFATSNHAKAKHLDLPAAEQRKLRTKQGRPGFGVELKIIDGEGAELPRDGVAFGDLHVRGPWVVSGYYEMAQSPLIDGWFPTGDVATIDADGFLRITDRSKDVVKSGGEWISSIALENVAMAHPAVLEAAVIACRHPKWDERPLLIAVVKAGAQLTRDELLAFYDGKVAKWWIPDDVVFVPELPHTATGKLLKTTLRDQYRDHPLPTASAASSGKVVA